MPNTTKTSRKHPVLLWIALVISATCNAVTSLAGLSTVVSVAFGVLTLICVIGLVVRYRSS
ncbi:MAG TPA: hypothetical protein VNO31_03905 [Umezawaea sp.]|nr:hypothetical protein [Umezawaea sp.]